MDVARELEGSGGAPGDDPVRPFDLRNLTTCSLSDRPSKVFVEDLGTPMPSDPAWSTFLDSLPKQLAANSLRRLCGHLQRIHRDQRLGIAALGGHVIKTGCAPYLIDLLHRNVLGAVALNGAAAIHDVELALAGKTSEDVGPRLLDGSFGMARDTADVIAVAVRRGQKEPIGLGRALGDHLLELDPPHADQSLIVQARRLGKPCTVHVAMGTDVVHMHPHVDAGALGESTMLDFRILATLVSRLKDGLWLNLGCAVILPEVFLKAVSIVRNFGHDLNGLVTANLDMIQQYRGRVNVCERPGDEGIAITGHHEILLPLVHAVVVAGLTAGYSTADADDRPAKARKAAIGKNLARNGQRKQENPIRRQASSPTANEIRKSGGAS